MAGVVYLHAISILCLCALPPSTNGKPAVAKQPPKPRGTTKHIKEIFIGRCWDFQRKPELNHALPTVKDCDRLWMEFHQAFANKDPCKVEQKDYEQFFNSATRGATVKKV